MSADPISRYEWDSVSGYLYAIHADGRESKSAQPMDQASAERTATVYGKPIEILTPADGGGGQR